MKTLSLSLRPRTFAQLFGQSKVTQAIQAQVKSGRMPNAWLFGGETGSGKTTVARIVALSLQCNHSQFGAPCKDCYKNRNVYCITEINASELNGVDAIRELAQTSNYAPNPPSLNRVIILDEAQRVTAQAQSVLLKYFEEAPSTTTWIIATTEPEKILKPLRSRCMVYLLHPLRGRDVEAFIQWAVTRAKITRPTDEFIEVIHRAGVTSPRLILMGLERFASGLDPDRCISSVETEVDTLRVCQALVRGEWGAIRSELEKATPDGARELRGAVLGYLRAVLLNPKETISKLEVGKAIEELGRVQFVDDTAMHAMLAAVLHRVVKRF